MRREMVARFRVLRDWITLVAALTAFSVTGNTPNWATQAMVRLFCASGGRSNDLLARATRLFHPPRELTGPSSVLVPINANKTATIAATLRDRGYYLYDQRVPQAVCDRLLKFALTQPATVRLPDREARQTIKTVYDPARPLGVRYDFSEAELINNPDVQALMADPAIVAAAQAYLGVEPMVDVVTMWWNTAYSDRPDAEAAQYYHFDLDRIKWVKFFIYLTDVTSDSGPHYFVAKSHRTGGIPASLLSKGYARLTDEDVASHYAAQDLIEFAAPRGTILAEDTRGLHKGQNVRTGHRLVLQIQFSNSLFGPPYPKVAFDKVVNSNLVAMARQHPHIYAAYTREKIA